MDHADAGFVSTKSLLGNERKPAPLFFTHDVLAGVTKLIKLEESMAKESGGAAAKKLAASSGL